MPQLPGSAHLTVCFRRLPVSLAEYTDTRQQVRLRARNTRKSGKGRREIGRRATRTSLDSAFWVVHGHDRFWRSRTAISNGGHRSCLDPRRRVAADWRTEGCSMQHHDSKCERIDSNRGLRTGRAWLMVLLLAVQAYPQSSSPEFPDPGNAHMSRDKQRALGLQAAAQVYQHMPVLPDSSPETQYIQALGKRLVATIPKDRTWPYQFHVV